MGTVKANKTVIHCEVNGNSAELYKALKQKTAALEIGLRLLARSEYAGAFFGDMQRVSAILGQETTGGQPANITASVEPTKIKEQKQTPQTISGPIALSIDSDAALGAQKPKEQAVPGLERIISSADDEEGFEDGWTPVPSSTTA